MRMYYFDWLREIDGKFFFFFLPAIICSFLEQRYNNLLSMETSVWPLVLNDEDFKYLHDLHADT